jgi:hypothetical protein
LSKIKQKKKHNLFTGYASFLGRLEMKFDDYQPPQAANTGIAYATTVAATTNIPKTIFFMISPP